MSARAAAASSVVAALILVACGAAGDEVSRGCGLEGTTAPPEGSAELVYSCRPEPNGGHRYEIFAVRPGEPARMLTHGEGANYWPSWSPDGRHIAFVSTRSGAEQLHVMNADGSDVVQITRLQGFIRDVAWSPDSTQIVFASGAAGLTGPLGVLQWPFDIYVARSDGTEARRLTLDGGLNNEPAWSPDGSQIAYTSDLGGPYQVWVMGSDGSDQHPLTSVGDNAAPDWSADGKQIVFHSDRDNPDRATIYIMFADGSGQRRVLIGGARADWSRDGEWVAFESDRDGPGEIYAIHPDGTGLTRLTNDGADKGHPRWGPP